MKTIFMSFVDKFHTAGSICVENFYFRYENSSPDFARARLNKDFEPDKKLNFHQRTEDV